jgi:cation diffusion facilitator CzcD-associated flavoprotein CzcO
MAKRDIEIAIVGAGMSGLVMGVRLKRAGIENFCIYEKASRVGGTWRENTYPGLTCDVPSFYYSYSFEPNTDWSKRFSPGPEIQTYFERVAAKYDLLPHVEFDTEVTDARFVDGRWQIETRDGKRSVADVFVLAAGPLHEKKYPEIAGLDSFAGDWFHSADWQHDVKLEGKRIGVIGTGSTAVQMMEPLSEVASQLTMFQRTAQWIMPVGNVEYSESQRRRSRRFPFIARLMRGFYRRMYDQFSVGVVEAGRVRDQIAKRCRANLAKVSDPELRAKLTPDYEPGCKRLIISTTFYPTLEKPHVDLVTDAIDRVVPAGIVTSNGTLHELDVLVTATGFDPLAWGVDHVVGPEGKSLAEAWASGTRTYRSIALPGFPNFFMLVGPNSPIGNISIIDVSETQSAYILKCIERLRSGEVTALDAKHAAAREFNERVKAAMQDTVWVTGCKSWYLDGEGDPITWPWSAQRFRKEMRRPRFEDFEALAS